MSILLDNLDKLTVINQTSSYIKCVCPVCLNPSLKISLSNHAYGAYRCYDNYCDPKDIRGAIGLLDTKNFHLSPYKQQISRSVYTDNQLTKKIESAKPVIVLPETEFIRCDDYQPIISTTRNFVNGSKKSTIYPYSSHQRVYRLDHIEPPDKKQIYLQYLDETGAWQVGNGSHTWPVYANGLDLTHPGNTVLFTEGEKCTEYVKENYGIACVTAAAPCFQLDYLYKIFYLFFGTNKNIQQLVVVPDNDDPGKHKAEIVQKVCWYLKKPCQIIPLQQFLNLNEEPPKGADLADFPVNNIKQFTNA